MPAIQENKKKHDDRSLSELTIEELKEKEKAINNSIVKIQKELKKQKEELEEKEKGLTIQEREDKNKNKEEKTKIKRLERQISTKQRLLKRVTDYQDPDKRKEKDEKNVNWQKSYANSLNKAKTNQNERKKLRKQLEDQEKSKISIFLRDLLKILKYWTIATLVFLIIAYFTMVAPFVKWWPFN